MSTQNEQNEQIPAWFEPLEKLIDTMGDMIVSMSGAPAQPAQPAPMPQPEKTESELLAEQINAGTVAITGTGKQDPNPISTFSSLASSKPTGGGDFSQIAAQINQGTKQIVEQSKKK